MDEVEHERCHVKIQTILIILWMIGVAAAYDNSSVTSAYLKLTNNDPIHAIHDANTAVWGDWFWLMLAGGPWLAMVLAHKSIHVATLWLTMILAAYGGDVMLGSGMIPTHIFYIVAALWLMSILIRLLSPEYTN